MAYERGELDNKRETVRLHCLEDDASQRIAGRGRTRVRVRSAGETARTPGRERATHERESFAFVAVPETRCGRTMR